MCVLSPLSNTADKQLENGNWLTSSIQYALSQIKYFLWKDAIFRIYKQIE